MLTLEQEATNFQTMKHIHRVRDLLDIMVVELLKRGRLHDQSKLSSPEVEGFTKHTSNLAKSEYESPEYQEAKRDMEQALAHHYANNRHHPEHFPDGVNGMNLIDILEMFCDWKAASERQNNGNIRTSIEKNAKKFQLSPQLVQIFENTIELVDGGN